VYTIATTVTTAQNALSYMARPWAFYGPSMVLPWPYHPERHPGSGVLALTLAGPALVATRCTRTLAVNRGSRMVCLW
jgi:hypothetical protein